MNGLRALDVSVVVCSYTVDRWTGLVDACRAVEAQLTASDSLTVVIDHNDELLGIARRELSATVVPSSGPPGLSGARNTGVVHASSSVVVFLDDDALPDANWLEPLRSAFEDDAVMVVGGGIDPRWEGSLSPCWLPREYLWVVGCDYEGLPPSGSEIRNPIGASMAIRRSAFDLVGGFNTGVGRQGNLPVGCEETEWCIRLKQVSPEARIVRESRSVVRHWVPTERQRLGYFVRRCYHEGRSKAWLAGAVGARDSLKSERAYVARSLTRGAADSLRDLGRGDVAGIARFGALPLGVACAAFGYLRVILAEGSRPTTTVQAPLIESGS